LMDWSERRYLDDEAADHSRFFARTDDARNGIPARHRPIETWRDEGTGVRRDAAPREQLPRAISGKDRREIRDGREDVAGGRDGKSAARFCYPPRRRHVRFAHRVQ